LGGTVAAPATNDQSPGAGTTAKARPASHLLSQPIKGK